MTASISFPVYIILISVSNALLSQLRNLYELLHISWVWIFAHAYVHSRRQQLTFNVNMYTIHSIQLYTIVLETYVCNKIYFIACAITILFQIVFDGQRWTLEESRFSFGFGIQLELNSSCASFLPSDTPKDLF